MNTFSIADFVSSRILITIFMFDDNYTTSNCSVYVESGPIEPNLSLETVGAEFKGVITGNLNWWAAPNGSNVTIQFTNNEFQTIHALLKYVKTSFMLVLLIKLY